MIFIFLLGRFQINICQRNPARMPRRQIQHRGARDRVIAPFQSMAIVENQGGWRLRRFYGSDLRGALGSPVRLSLYAIRRWRKISPISSPASVEDSGTALIVGFFVVSRILVSRILGRIGIRRNSIPSPKVGNETPV